MRDAGSERMLLAVSDQQLHIAIDVSVAEDQIHGRIRDGVRQPRQFFGWLGLIGELDQILGSPRSDFPGPAPASSDTVSNKDREGER